MQKNPTQFRYSVPVLDFGKVETVVRLLDALITAESCPEGTPAEILESLFVFACMQNIIIVVYLILNSCMGCWWRVVCGFA